MSQLQLIAQAEKHSDRIAFRTPSYQRSYRDLLFRSESIAGSLLESCDDLEEARVAYLVSPGFEYAATQWAIWRAGGVAVPHSLSATEKELEYTLSDSETSCIVTSIELAPKVNSLCKKLNLRLLIHEEIEDSTPACLPDVGSERRAMILYTSGTTSKPKGVVTTHGCIQAQIESLVEAWQWQTDDQIPLFLPLHHIHGIINIMSCALWSGATIEPFARFDLDTILRNVAEDAYTVFMAVPTIYVKIISALQAMPAAEQESIIDGFGRMRLMISGSAALPASIHEQWTELTGQKLLERYGMTEIGMALSNPYDGERRPGVVGQPLPGVEIRLQSEQNEVICEENKEGEIQVRGPNVFLEYWNRPKVTQNSFDGDWFKTGDIGVLEDGYYRIMGRSSVDIIKSGGYKLSALEIEASLLDHPSIRECAVVGLPNETWGETVAAAVVVNNNCSLDLESLQSWCEDKISAYKIPRRLMIADNLPRNAMGKVTKPSVSDLFKVDA